MSFAIVTRLAALMAAIQSAAGAIEVYTGTTITPEAPKAIPAVPPDPSANPVTSPRTTALRRREIDHVTSKPLDVVYSATIDAATSQPVTVIYATRLDPVTGRPVDVFSMNERKSAEWVASTQLDPQTGAPVGTVYARRFDVRTGRPMDIVRTVPLRSASASKSRIPSAEPARRAAPAATPDNGTGSKTPAPPVKREPPPAMKNPEPAKPTSSSTATTPKPKPGTAAATSKPAPTREGLAGTWWCVAPSWSSGVIEIAADGTYTRPGGVKGTYRIQGTNVIFDGGLKAWDNGRARFEDGNLIFEWTNPDGGQNYFAFRKG